MLACWPNSHPQLSCRPHRAPPHFGTHRLANLARRVAQQLQQRRKCVRAVAAGGGSRAAAHPAQCELG